MLILFRMHFQPALLISFPPIPVLFSLFFQMVFQLAAEKYHAVE